jgi:hypothetical protein
MTIIKNQTVRLHYAPLVLLLVLTAATFGEVLTHSFLPTWDDTFYITENPAVRGFSLQHVVVAFTTNYHGNYAPVQILSYMLDYAFWGMEPFGFLLTNLVCHAVSGLLLYGLLVRQGFWKWGAFLGSALFLVHPVQVESVAWLSQRKNLLAMLFFLLAFHAWLSYRESTGKPSWVWYGASIGALLLSLLSKSVAVVFPVMLVMYDALHPPATARHRCHLEKMPHLLVALAVTVLTVVLQSMENGGGRAEYPPDALIVLPLTMVTVLAGYLQLLLWPAAGRLSTIYTPPFRTSFDADVAVGVAVVVFLTLAGIWLFRRSRQGFFWYALFFLGLVPVSQIIPLITIMNDRYLYFPMLGIAGFAAWASGELRPRYATPVSRSVAVAVVSGVVIALAAASHLRGRLWKDAITLFLDTVPKVENVRQQWFMLADGYRAAGDERSAGMCDRRAMTPGPLNDSDYLLLGRLYFDRGEPEKVRQLAERLIKEGKWGGVGMFLLGEYDKLRKNQGQQ